MLKRSAALFVWAKAERLPEPTIFRVFQGRWRTLTKPVVPVPPAPVAKPASKGPKLIFRDKVRSKTAFSGITRS